MNGSVVKLAILPNIQLLACLLKLTLLPKISHVLTYDVFLTVNNIVKQLQFGQV